jgi:hypothetical protein
MQAKVKKSVRVIRAAGISTTPDHTSGMLHGQDIGERFMEQYVAMSESTKILNARKKQAIAKTEDKKLVVAARTHVLMHGMRQPKEVVKKGLVLLKAKLAEAKEAESEIESVFGSPVSVSDSDDDNVVSSSRKRKSAEGASTYTRELREAVLQNSKSARKKKKAKKGDALLQRRSATSNSSSSSSSSGVQHISINVNHTFSDDANAFFASMNKKKDA